MRQITHVDCFSGPGGICTGFRAAGIKTLLAIEKVQTCATTYSANHKDVPVIVKDIRHVTEEDIREHIKKDFEVDIVTSGMPCETFSTAGSKSRSFYDDRQYLFMEGIRIAKLVNAKMILFENVPGIVTKTTEKHGDRLIIDELFDALKESGYKYYVDTILNSADFGVPQLRDRFFVLASKNERDLRIPVSCRENYVTVEDAFFDLPEVEANETVVDRDFKKVACDYTRLLKDNLFWKLDVDTPALTYHIAPKHRECSIQRFSMIEPGEGLKHLFDKLTPEEINEYQKKRILPKKWYIQRNRRLVLNKPSVTVTSHCLDELLHPRLNRAITVREAARLQSFPDGYDFAGGPYVCPHNAAEQDKYEQIGDAVPPLLAYAWGMTIKGIMGVD